MYEPLSNHNLLCIAGIICSFQIILKGNEKIDFALTYSSAALMFLFFYGTEKLTNITISVLEMTFLI